MKIVDSERNGHSILEALSQLPDYPTKSELYERLHRSKLAPSGIYDTDLKSLLAVLHSTCCYLRSPLYVESRRKITEFMIRDEKLCLPQGRPLNLKVLDSFL